jgi:hypothetical protein
MPATRRGPAQSYRSEAEHFAAWLRIARRQWIDIDDTIIDQYAAHDCRCPVWRKRGKLVATGAKRRRRALGTSSSFCEAEVSSHRLNRWRTMTRTCRLTWHGSSNIAAPPTRRSGLPDRYQTAHADAGRAFAMGCRRTQERIPTTKQGDAGLGIAARHDNEELHPVSGRAWRVPAALLHAVPSVQRYRLSTLPRHVDPATIERIIAACPTDRPVEVRDKAIILCSPGSACGLPIFRTCVSTTSTGGPAT